MKKKLAFIVIVLVLSGSVYGLTNNFNQVAMLGKVAIKFVENVNFNGFAVINTSRVCFADNTCINSSVLSNISSSTGLITSNNNTLSNLIANMNSNGTILTQQGVLLNTTGTQPSCDATKRGMLWFTYGGLGVADHLQVCAKSALDLYAWGTIV